MSKPQPDVNLKPFQPYGIPILKLLAGLFVLSLAVTAIYELIL